MTFFKNFVGYHGGAVYISLNTSFWKNNLVMIFADIYLNGNTAFRVPNPVYLYVTNLCDNSCLTYYINAITGINHTNIATNLNKLIL